MGLVECDRLGCDNGHVVALINLGNGSQVYICDECKEEFNDYLGEAALSSMEEVYITDQLYNFFQTRKGSKRLTTFDDFFKRYEL